MAHNPGFLKLVNDAKSRVKEIDIEGYKKIVSSGDPHVLVDTREDSEWTEGHVKGAVHLSKGIIERDIESKAPDKATKLGGAPIMAPMDAEPGRLAVLSDPTGAVFAVIAVKAA